MMNQKPSVFQILKPVPHFLTSDTEGTGKVRQTQGISTSVIPSRRLNSTILVVSMVPYLLWLGCCLATTNQSNTPPTFKPLKHQIESWLDLASKLVLY